MVISNVYAAAHFALELDGKKDVGVFRSIEGGGVKADVMTYAYNANQQTQYTRWKLLGKPKFEDLKFQVGMAMSEPFYDWMKDFFVGKPTRKNGAIIAADFYYNERARRTFKEAMIKEITFPKLDGSDKNPVYMNVTVAVEDMEFGKGSGAKLDVPKGFDKQRVWNSANFKFRLDDYAGICSRVTKIDSFTIKQNIIEYHAGGFKAPIKTPGPVEFPNITFYLPETDAQPLMDHVARRVGFGGKGRGEVRSATTMHGQLEACDNKMESILTLDLYGADIISVTPDRSDATSEELKLCKVELYTESMTLTYANLEDRPK